MKTKLPYFIGGLILIAVIIFLIVQKEDPHDPNETEAVTCPPGRTVYRFKYPSKAFPLSTREYEASFNATTDLLKRIVDSAGQVSLGLEATNKVVELQEKLNQDNITFTTGLRSYFFSHNNDPCNEALQAKYTAYVDSTTIRMLELRKFIVQSTRNEQKGSADIDTTLQRPLTLEKDTAALIKAVNDLRGFITDN